MDLLLHCLTMTLHTSGTVWPENSLKLVWLPLTLCASGTGSTLLWLPGRAVDWKAQHKSQHFLMLGMVHSPFYWQILGHLIMYLQVLPIERYSGFKTRKTGGGGNWAVSWGKPKTKRWMWLNGLNVLNCLKGWTVKKVCEKGLENRSQYSWWAQKSDFKSGEP